MKPTFRPALPSDEMTLVELYNRVFDGSFTRAIWDWRYHQNPFSSKTYSMLAEVDGEIVSHYGASLVQFSLNGQTIPGALYVDAFTDPEIKGMNLFRHLGLALEDDLRDDGVKLLLAFPNEISHRLFYHDLAWRDILEIPMLRLSKDNVRGQFRSDDRIALASPFDSRFNQLWESLVSQPTAWTVRDSRYLKYRYQTNPKHDYLVFTLSDEGALAGYAVAKKFEGGFDLMDIIAKDGDLATTLLDHVIGSAFEMGANEINTWLPVRHPLHHHLESRGFENQSPVVYMMAKIIGDLPKSAPDVFDPRNWFYTMGDSDVY